MGYMGDGVMHPHWGSLVHEQGKIQRVNYELAKERQPSSLWCALGPL